MCIRTLDSTTPPPCLHGGFLLLLLLQKPTRLVIGKKISAQMLSPAQHAQCVLCIWCPNMPSRGQVWKFSSKVKLPVRGIQADEVQPCLSYIRVCSDIKLILRSAADNFTWVYNDKRVFTSCGLEPCALVIAMHRYTCNMAKTCKKLHHYWVNNELSYKQIPCLNYFNLSMLEW